TSVSARAPRPTRSRAARAGSRNSCSARALRQKRKEWPACACTASAALSSAVNSVNSELIWNERASPSWLRRCTGSAVMSPPSKRIRPESGATSPASWPIRVVLPAPFGPMTACSSPRTTSSMMWSDATTPSKRLARSSICSKASAMTEPRRRIGDLYRTPSGRLFEQSVDPTPCEQHHEQQQRPEDDLPVLGDAGQYLLEQQ